MPNEYSYLYEAVIEDMKNSLLVKFLERSTSSTSCSQRESHMKICTGVEYCQLIHRALKQKKSSNGSMTQRYAEYRTIPGVC
jgi:hypothetical protein